VYDICNCACRSCASLCFSAASAVTYWADVSRTWASCEATFFVADSWANLKATIRQTEQVITIATRGPGVAIDQTLYLDGRSHPSNLQLLGANCLAARTAWSGDQKQLLVSYQIKTKQGKEGQLIVTRYLINEAKTEVVVFTLKLNAEPDETSARQIWNKQA
jgi:hypothetical protein